MVTTTAFSQFARRISSTQGCPYVTVAETQNPIQDLDAAALLMRARAMLPSVIDGLTLPRTEIERRLKDVVREQVRPAGVVRSGKPL